MQRSADEHEHDFDHPLLELVTETAEIESADATGAVRISCVDSHLCESSYRQLGAGPRGAWRSTVLEEMVGKDRADSI